MYSNRFQITIKNYAIAIARLDDWLKQTSTRASFSANENPIASCTRDFPTLQVIALNSDWFTAHFSPVVFEWRNSFVISLSCVTSVLFCIKQISPSQL